MQLSHSLLQQKLALMMTPPFLNILLFTTQLLKWIKSTHCSVHSHCLFLILECSMQWIVQKCTILIYSIIFNDVGKYSRTTRYFSRIKDKTSFDSKFKDNSWRSRTSGNLSITPSQEGLWWTEGSCSGVNITTRVAKNVKRAGMRKSVRGLGNLCLKCGIQSNKYGSQLATPRGAMSFLRGPNFFKL